MHEGQFIGFGQYSEIISRARANIILNVDFDIEKASKLLPFEYADESVDVTECRILLQKWQDIVDKNELGFINPFDFEDEFSDSKTFNAPFVLASEQGGILISYLH